MEKILITGANSYIGTEFEKYIKENFSNDYVVDTVDMIDGKWRERTFSGYHTVFHVAGIAHQKETKQNAQLYYKVNRDLAIETAQKAKDDGVNQFIFLSSMSVFGMETGVITEKTIPMPKSNYGKSKLQAEKEINKLADETFKVCIVRPPMVYGLGCKGNFQQIVKIVNKFPVFPKIKNERSMIYIENLSSFVKLTIDQNLCGIYYPQNSQYMRTDYMAKSIANKLNKKIYLSNIFGLIVFVIRPFLSIAKKAFGTLIYKDMESFDFSYNQVSLFESIAKSVQVKQDE